eukprot:GHVR01048343.1.p1 GENE.GHVR01048343.1~~GHVR01048343.1.p1  ORF type:complete len:354 (+),score=54.03 GHVR01048343.1:78-1139(+)
MRSRSSWIKGVFMVLGSITMLLGLTLVSLGIVLAATRVPEHAKSFEVLVEARSELAHSIIWPALMIFGSGLLTFLASKWQSAKYMQVSLGLDVLVMFIFFLVFLYAKDYSELLNDVCDSCDLNSFDRIATGALGDKCLLGTVDCIKELNTLVNNNSTNYAPEDFTGTDGFCSKATDCVMQGGTGDCTKIVGESNYVCHEGKFCLYPFYSYNKVGTRSYSYWVIYELDKEAVCYLASVKKGAVTVIGIILIMHIFQIALGCVLMCFFRNLLPAEGQRRVDIVPDSPPSPQAMGKPQNEYDMEYPRKPVGGTQDSFAEFYNTPKKHDDDDDVATDTQSLPDDDRLNTNDRLNTLK